MWGRSWRALCPFRRRVGIGFLMAGLELGSEEGEDHPRLLASATAS